jgi:hypothetical protein
MSEVQAPGLICAALRIDLEYRQRICASAQAPPGGIRRTPRSADGQDLGPGSTNGAHERRPAHSQDGQQLRCG